MERQVGQGDGPARRYLRLQKYPPLTLLEVLSARLVTSWEFLYARASLRPFPRWNTHYGAVLFQLPYRDLCVLNLTCEIRCAHSRGRPCISSTAPPPPLNESYLCYPARKNDDGELYAKHIDNKGKTTYQWTRDYNITSIIHPHQLKAFNFLYWLPLPVLDLWVCSEV